MKNIGAGIAVAALYAFTGWLIYFVEQHNGGGFIAGLGFLILLVNALAATWRLVINPLGKSEASSD